MQVEERWEDASGEVSLSAQHLLAGPLGLRVVRSDPKEWTPESRCALEAMHAASGQVLYRHSLRTYPGGMQVRLIPHPAGILVLTSWGVGRHQGLGAEWRAWALSRSV
jgi:hypothetical protein